MTTYGIEVLHVNQLPELAALKQAVAQELLALGLHRTVAIAVGEDETDDDAPSVGVWLGSQLAKSEVNLVGRAAELARRGTVVIPVVKDMSDFSSFVPDVLSFANGAEWSNEDGLKRLVRVLLEELGIEEARRKVFISHKRSDGMMAAEQIHDALSHNRFIPFIDRFAIAKGRDAQKVIADELEDYAFVLLLETPQAHSSDWVHDELEYALSHGMGVLIYRWPDVATAIPGSTGIPRVELEQTDIVKDSHGHDILTEAAIENLVANVEAAHASALCRRRRYLIQSIQDAASSAGFCSIPMRNWQVLVDLEDAPVIVGTTPRLPSAHDLQALAESAAQRTLAPQTVLVHSARALPGDLRRHLDWVVDARDVTILPENAIGRYW